MWIFWFYQNIIECINYRIYHIIAMYNCIHFDNDILPVLHCFEIIKTQCNIATLISFLFVLFVQKEIVFFTHFILVQDLRNYIWLAWLSFQTAQQRSYFWFTKRKNKRCDEKVWLWNCSSCSRRSGCGLFITGQYVSLCALAYGGSEFALALGMNILSLWHKACFFSGQLQRLRLIALEPSAPSVS